MKQLKSHIGDLSKANFSQHVDPLVQRILVARNIFDDEDLDHRLAGLPRPEKLLGMEAAVTLLASALQKQQHILILGDYDVDGATSTALALRALRAMGAANVSFLVPNRFEFGYGLSKAIAEVALQTSPDLIVTVDNGISSIEGVAWLQQQGIDVVVTDHHLPGDHLPNASAIVNPNQPGCEFPSKHLAGVGVLFYVMLGLRAYLRTLSWFEDNGIEEPKMERYLDLVALGTVADLVPLDKVNRILVTKGLQSVRAGRCNPGIQALFDVSGRSIETARASDFGFAIGPRINAAGRLEDIAEGIHCLMTDSPRHARELAIELHAINQERQQIQAQMTEDAENLVTAYLEEDISGHLRTTPAGICCYSEHWHQGVVGLVASRIKDNLHRPTIAFAPASVDSGEQGELKGSGRSIPGIHLRDILDRVATQYPQLIQKFGGHAMAAGLSIREQDYQQFAKVFDTQIAQQATEALFQQTLWSDGELRADSITLDLALQLETLLPWGQHLAEPQFHGDFRVVTVRVLKDKHFKLELADHADKYQFNAIWFNAASVTNIEEGDQLAALYKLSVNRFRGQQNLQLMIVEHISPNTP